MDFVKLQPVRHPRLTGTDKDRAEGRYWRSFKSPVFLKSYAAIEHAHFSPAAPHRYCITSGTRLQLYSPKTNRVVKTISRFSLPCRSGEFRHDGKLVIAADDSGLVQVFDVNSRAVLRTLKGHAQPVHVAKFSPPSGGSLAVSEGAPGEASSSASTLLTCSDDATVRLWDLSTASPLRAFTPPTGFPADYVRAGAFLPSSSSLVLSGSYDGYLRLWDARAGESGGLAWSGRHGHPIESVVVHDAGTLGVSAGGPIVRVWDLLGASGGAGVDAEGGRCLRAMSNHQKTVTSLVWSGDRRRLLSAGLDGLVKVYDAEEGSFRVRHTMRYGGALTCLAVSPTDESLVVGAADGTLCVRKRRIGAEEKERRARGFDAVAFESQLKGLGESASGIVKGVQEARALDSMAKGGRDGEDSSGEDASGKVMVVREKKKKKLQPWDRMLKSFRYGDALDTVLRPTVPPNTTFTLLLELIYRDGLHAALAGRDDVGLAPILKLLNRNVTDPRWCRIACDVLHVIVDIYNAVIGKSPLVDDLFVRLKAKVSAELQLQRELMQVQGQVEMVMSGITGAMAVASSRS